MLYRYAEIDIMWFDMGEYDLRNDGPDFDLQCPKCDGHCIGKTYPHGVNGTYVEAYTGYCVKRIICNECGIIGELSLEDQQPSLPHVYWYRFTIRGGTFWAQNQHRLQDIYDVLTGRIDRNHSALYALPKWLITRTNREKAIQVIKVALQTSAPNKKA